MKKKVKSVTKISTKACKEFVKMLLGGPIKMKWVPKGTTISRF